MEMRLITIPRGERGGVRHIELDDAAIAAFLQAHAQGNGNSCVFELLADSANRASDLRHP